MYIYIIFILYTIFLYATIVKFVMFSPVNTAILAGVNRKREIIPLGFAWNTFRGQLIAYNYNYIHIYVCIYMFR